MLSKHFQSCHMIPAMVTSFPSASGPLGPYTPSHGQMSAQRVKPEARSSRLELDDEKGQRSAGFPPPLLFPWLVLQTSLTLPLSLTHLCPHGHPGPFSSRLSHAVMQAHTHTSLFLFHTSTHSLASSCMCTWAGICHHSGNWHSAVCVAITRLICL